MYWWVVYVDNHGKLGRSGSYLSETRAQRWADDNVNTRYWLIPSKGRTWEAARNEVKQKLAERLRDAGMATERVYKELDLVEG